MGWRISSKIRREPGSRNTRALVRVLSRLPSVACKSFPSDVTICSTTSLLVNNSCTQASESKKTIPGRPAMSNRQKVLLPVAMPPVTSRVGQVGMGKGGSDGEGGCGKLGESPDVHFYAMGGRRGILPISPVPATEKGWRFALHPFRNLWISTSVKGRVHRCCLRLGPDRRAGRFP